MSNKEDVGTTLKSITDYVRDCQARVIKGEILDLQGLDRNVMKICDAVAKLPEDEGAALEGSMNGLIESLEVLARLMKEQQDHLTGSGRGR